MVTLVAVAELHVEGDQLVLHLTAGEKVASIHGDQRVPLSSVRQVEVLDDAHQAADRGLKVGERLPGVVEVGLVYTKDRKLFAAVHHQTPRGVRLVLEGAAHDEWIVGCADPEAVAASVRSQLHLPG